MVKQLKYKIISIYIYMEKITAIFLDGQYDATHLDFYREHVKRADYLVAADGGVNFLNGLGIEPDLLVGDGDGADFSQAKAKEILKHPKDKDKTDGELAIEEALKRRPNNRINIYGALTRAEEADHFIGNLGILYSAHETGKVVLRDVRQDIYAVFGGNELTIVGEIDDTISLACFGCEVAENVKTQGLRWPVNSNILPGVGRFLRNRLNANSARISVERGALFVFHYKKGEDPLSYSI